jgi:hypothetical protein
MEHPAQDDGATPPAGEGGSTPVDALRARLAGKDEAGGDTGTGAPGAGAGTDRHRLPTATGLPPFPSMGHLHRGGPPMPEPAHAWTFTVLDIAARPHAAAPELTARLRVDDASGDAVQAIALRCQVSIEPQRRGYDLDDEEGLRAVFGGRERWPETMRPFQWMQVSTVVQGFRGSTVVDLPMPCTYDFDVTGSRYLHAVGAGTIPLTLELSGTVFGRGPDGLTVEQLSWGCRARYQLPVLVWRDMLETYFPHSGWIRLDHDVLASLGDYRARHGLVSWEETVTRLLDAVESREVTP